MNISTLIAELQKLQALHGDLPVTKGSDIGIEPSEIAYAEMVPSNYYNTESDYLDGPIIHLS